MIKNWKTRCISLGYLGESYRRHGFVTRDHRSRNHRELRKFLAAKVLKILSRPDNKDLLWIRVQKVAVVPQFSLRPKVSRSKLGNCYRNRTSSHCRGVFETKTKLQDTMVWKTIDLQWIGEVVKSVAPFLGPNVNQHENSNLKLLRS